MPSPNVANKSSPAAKKVAAATATEKKSPQQQQQQQQDLGRVLTKRKSQDFKSKVAGWNQAVATAGEAEQGENGEDEVVVVVEEDSTDEDVKDVMIGKSPEKGTGAGDEAEARAKGKASTPQKSPKTPAGGNTPTKKIPSSRKPSREIDHKRQVWVRRKAKAQEKQDKPDKQETPEKASPAVKEVATPKKRVVSDGHWRKDRIASDKAAATPEKKKDAEKEKEATPKPTVIRRSVVSVGLKVPPSVQDFAQPELEPVKVKPLNRHSRSRSPPGDGSSPAYQSPGMKVYIKKTRPTDRAEKHVKGVSASESSFTATSFDGPSTATDITTPDRLPVKAEHSRRPSSEPKPPISKRVSKSDERRDASTRIASGDRGGQKKISTTDQTRQSAKILTQKPHDDNNPPRPVPKVYGKRIEGWLAGMGEDPFTDQPKSFPPLDPIDIPRKTKRTVRERVDDIENEPSDRRRSSGRKRTPRASLEALDLNERSRRSRSPVDDWSDASQRATPTLKRSGARRGATSPVKRGASSSHDRHRNLPQLPLSNSRRYVTSAGPSQRVYHLDEDVRVSRESRQSHGISRGFVDAGDMSVLSRASDGDEPRESGNLKRRLTKHSDLISVLSQPQEEQNKQIPSRTNKSRRSKPANLTIGELMNEITTDELKYQRELRTLVDGVVPVLLNYILKTDTPSGPGSRKSSARNDSSLTQPIVDMGVALERLKATHKRIPMHDPEDLLRWAEGAAKVYDDYLKVWRLGFHDIVVNLAPAEETSRKSSWDQGLQRNAIGDLTKSDGERVDVAYLLKRPLVRLKNLKRTFSSIDQIKPSTLSKDIEARYQNLVLDARARANDERARLEDEAAAAIDPTRARDVESLAPLNGVNIDPTRSVKARDYFDMQLYHSTGQQLDCKIEVIMRDDAPARGTGGDLLFCEVSPSGRWLLFPPLLAQLASARQAERDGEMVVMLRGVLASGNEWRELMLLKSSEEQCEEWIAMLGSDPMPPSLNRQSSFNAVKQHRPSKNYSHAASSDLTEDLHLPIGERAHHTARKWDGSEVNSVVGDLPAAAAAAASSPLPRAKPTRYRESSRNDYYDERPRNTSRFETDSGPREYYDDRKGNGGRQRYDDYSPKRPSRARSKSEYSDYTATSSRNDYSVWMPSSKRGFSDDESADEEDRPSPRRPSMQRRTSSVPSQDLPRIPKQRKGSGNETPRRELDLDRGETGGYDRYDEARSAPSKLRKPPPQQPPLSNRDEELKKAAQPASQNNKSTFGEVKANMIPSFTPAFLRKSRRSSSPLKHEYEPSTASDLSMSESELSDSDLDEGSVTSKSSAEQPQENVSTLGELKDFGKFGMPRPTRQRPMSAEIPPPVAEDDGLGPSDSASQAPPRSASQPPTPSSTKTVACIFCWSDSGAWDSLHPQECEIVVTPGLIEAFDVAQAHQVSPNAWDPSEPSPSQRGVKPLVALELTPLVPLRRGTALDISIRSPPTSNSLLRTGNHIMFRSRSPEECEKLYSYINRARIDNPTWIALQNARGPMATSNWAEVMDKRNASRSNPAPAGSSWLKTFSRKSSTYRSTGTRGAVSTAATESSVGTINSAFSALRRFSAGSRFFNIAKSAVLSREAGRTGSTGSDSLESGFATPIPLDPSMGTPAGVSNAKIRLWLRESAGKWRDMGAARLTVLFPPRPAMEDALAADPMRIGGAEKRVLVMGKTKDIVILDVTLPEGCFERVARTGIAVSILEESEGARARGGVLTTKARVYMLQMKTERDAAYTFSMVGKLRY